MMSVKTPPLSRSGSSPSTVGLANRSGASATPPTSLSLRSSYNQLLGRDVIKESMETGSSATLPKSRQRYAMTSVRSAMGISDNLAFSALYSSSSSSSLFNTTNPKLVKNGANMQRRAESQQLELSRANTEGKIDNDLINNPTSDWLEFEKDNSQLPPFRRRTKSFLEYHGKGWDLDLNQGNKEDKGEKKQQPSPEKEQASPNQFLQQYPPSSPKQARAAEKTTPTRNRAPPPQPEPETGLPKVGLRMDLTPETPSEDEDSSWTTLSQESPSPQTPKETDVWVEGELPPGWREISDSSEVYFWHVPTGTTQYDRPVRPSSLISDSSVEPVPSPSGSSPSPSSSSSTPFNDITSSVQSLNTTTSCTATVSHNY
uniref:Amyloid beta precursor protein binding family B member 2 n=1 Tax=Pundamilia nyererei TaxID=303518 RepID=A0A3B4EY99_9CICH